MRPWVIWLSVVVALIQMWAFVDNLIDRDWVLTVCFGLSTIAFVVLVVVLIYLRRRAGRQGQRVTQ